MARPTRTAAYATEHLPLLDDALELADLLTAAWPDQLADLRAAGVPLNVDDDQDEDADGDSDGQDADADAGDEEKDVDWKARARQHERRAKQNKAAADRAAAELQELRAKDQTEAEKAIEEAKKAAREEAISEVNQERRSDRLETSVTRLAARGVTIDEKVVKFDDPDDALTYVERAIAKGDLDAEDVFDENHKVVPDVVEDYLTKLLKRKPALAATATGRPAPGASDAGKGSGGSKAAEDMSVEDHMKQVTRTT